MNSHSEGYKRAVDQNWGRMTKIGFLDQKLEFRFQKKPLLEPNHVLATPGKSSSKKKVAFSQINISLLRNFGLKPIFRPKTTFQPNVKTAVSLEFRPGPGLLSFWVIFFMARTVPPSFVEIRPKLRVLIPLTWEWP